MSGFDATVLLAHRISLEIMHIILFSGCDLCKISFNCLNIWYSLPYETHGSRFFFSRKVFHYKFNFLDSYGSIQVIYFLLGE